MRTMCRMVMYACLLSFTFQYIAVSCHQCPNSSIQLVGGRIEVCAGGCWGPVCIGDSGWSLLDAAVACRQLNMSSQGKVHLFTALTTTALFHHLLCWLPNAQRVSRPCSAVHCLHDIHDTSTSTCTLLLEWNDLVMLSNKTKY